MRNYFIIIYTLIASLFLPNSVFAGELTSVQDVIPDSRPSARTEHYITFYVQNTVPVSGKIVVTPSAGDFNIESGFSFTDVDLLINNTQKPLSSSPGTGLGSPVGVSAVTGTSGSLSLTLNDSDAISPGDLIEIRVGSSTTLGGVGTKTIQLPSVGGGYNIDIKTQNSSSVDIDAKTTMIFVLEGVGVNASNVVPTPPPPPPSPTPTPTPAASASVPQGGGAVISPIISVGLPTAGGAGLLTNFISNTSGSVLITNATSTVIITPPVVNSFARVAIPMINDKANVVIFPIDEHNKLIITIPNSFGPPNDDILLVIRKTPRSEISNIPLPANRDIIDGGIYKVNLYVNGLSVEKLFKPIILAVFYGDDSFQREPVELYHAKDENPSWSIVSDVTKDLDSGFVTIRNLQDLSIFATMGVKIVKPLTLQNEPPAPLVVSSDTHPNQYEDYKDPSPEFNWKLSNQIDQVSFILDQNPSTIPDDVPEGHWDYKNYQNLPDGTWYFHIKAGNSLGWGKTSHFIVQIRSESKPLGVVKSGIVKIRPIPLNPSYSEVIISQTIFIFSLFLLFGCIRCNRSCREGQNS